MYLLEGVSAGWDNLINGYGWYSIVAGVLIFFLGALDSYCEGRGTKKEKLVRALIGGLKSEKNALKVFFILLIYSIWVSPIQQANESILKSANEFKEITTENLELRNKNKALKNRALLESLSKDKKREIQIWLNGYIRTGEKIKSWLLDPSQDRESWVKSNEEWVSTVKERITKQLGRMDIDRFDNPFSRKLTLDLSRIFLVDQVIADMDKKLDYLREIRDEYK